MLSQCSQQYYNCTLFEPFPFPFLSLLFGWMEKRVVKILMVGIGIVRMLTLEEKKKVGNLVLKWQRSGHAFNVLQEKDKKRVTFSVLPNRSLASKQEGGNIFLLYSYCYFLDGITRSLLVLGHYWTVYHNPKALLLPWKMMPKTSFFSF